MSIQRIRLVLVLSLLAPWPAQAAPIYYSLASASVTVYPSGQSTGDSQLVYSTDTLGPLDVSTSGAAARASVVDGALRAFATSDGVNATANATAGFFDTLVLHSATLPVGTLVQLQGELVLTRQLSSNGLSAPCASSAVVSASLDASLDNEQAIIQDGTCDLNDIYVPTAVFTGIIGQEMGINAFLSASVGSFQPATADAGNTLRFFLTPLGDFTYTTASGNSYLQPPPSSAPEPTSLVLLGTALAFAGARRARRRG